VLLFMAATLLAGTLVFLAYTSSKPAAE
jgi:hypothetical protein